MEVLYYPIIPPTIGGTGSVWVTNEVRTVLTTLVLRTVVVIGLALNMILYSWVSVSVTTVLWVTGEVTVVKDGARPSGLIGGRWVGTGGREDSDGGRVVVVYL